MRRIAVAICVFAAVAAGAASTHADDAARVDVAVGETIEREVGFALGLRCDDLTIVRAELRASTPESNTFSVTGVATGTTTCRVGTDPGRPTYLFEIRVVAARRTR